ncbi:MAG: GNAT family N-acetyltransferase [Egibacteraceae bacterium]
MRAWQAAYRGIMADAYLDGLRVADRREWWRSVLTDPPEPYTHRLVVEDGGGIVRGFACAGPSRRDDGDEAGELWVINLAPDAWGLGLGRALLGAITGLLQAAGYREAVLWSPPPTAEPAVSTRRPGGVRTGPSPPARSTASRSTRSATAAHCAVEEPAPAASSGIVVRLQATVRQADRILVVAAGGSSSPAATTTSSPTMAPVPGRPRPD